MTSENDTTTDSGEHTKPFLEHLVDLRFTIVWSAVALIVGMLIALPLAPKILDVLKVPVAKAGMDPDSFLKIMQVAGGFSVAMRITFWTGIMFSVPLIAYLLARFVFPGLTGKEVKAVTCSCGFATILFVAGVSMGYFFTVPVAIKMMLRINAWLGVTSEWVELADYVAFVLKLLIAFGCAFQLPVVVLALGYLGVIDSVQLRDKRNYVIVGLMVLAMLLTPQDPYTMVLMALPLIVLYEVCIWIIWLKERKK